MKLVVFSDIHYALRPLDSYKAKRKLSQFALPVVDKLIDIINNRICPDVVVNLGDLIEDVHNSVQDIENFQLIWNVLQKINRPFYSAIGNTETRSISKVMLKEMMGYKSHTFSVDIKGYHLVILGITAKHNADGTYIIQFLKEDLNWLKRDLQQNNLPCLIFTHYGLAEDNMKGNWWYEKCPQVAVLQERKEIKQILERDNHVIAIFSGHQHWTKKCRENGLDYYICGSLTENIQDDGIPDGVYFEIDIINQTIKLQEHHIKLDI